MTGVGSDWRVLDGVATAWFDATSLVQSAALAARVGEVSPDVALDLRASGVRVRLEDVRSADAVSTVARELGLAADPVALQSLTGVVESADPVAVERFW